MPEIYLYKDEICIHVDYESIMYEAIKSFEYENELDIARSGNYFIITGGTIERYDFIYYLTVVTESIILL